jgi:hypothetical protein
MCDVCEHKTQRRVSQDCTAPVRNMHTVAVTPITQRLGAQNHDAWSFIIGHIHEHDIDMDEEKVIS